MSGGSPIEAYRARWRRFREGVRKPPHCISCRGSRLAWKQWRTRALSLLVDEAVVYDPTVPVRRVRCRDCGRSWTIQPPGVAPRKHYQLDVVAHAAASYLFDSQAALEQVAATIGCARRTLGRWIAWVAALASPAVLLARLASLTEAPIVPRRPPLPAGAWRRPAHRERAAEVLTLFEAIGAALGAEPSGLRAVLERLGCVPSYAAPALPDPLPILAR